MVIDDILGPYHNFFAIRKQKPVSNVLKLLFEASVCEWQLTPHRIIRCGLSNMHMSPCDLEFHITHDNVKNLKKVAPN